MVKSAKHFIDQWSIPLFLALALNLVLFILMPGLIQTVPQRIFISEANNNLQVIRLKPPGKKINKKLKVVPQKSVKQEIKPLKRSQLQVSQPVNQKIYFPLQLNYRLPARTQTISMPPIEMPAINPPNLEGVYGIHEIDAPLTPLANMHPFYPRRAERLDIQGWVKIEYIVNKQGLVENIVVLDSDPVDVFENSVVNTVGRWRFKPATVEGIPVKTRIVSTIKFELANMPHPKE